MPTSHDETLQQRYARERQMYLGQLAQMTPQEIADLDLQLHNALAQRDQLLAALERAVERQAYKPGYGPAWWEDANAAIAAVKGGNT